MGFTHHAGKIVFKIALGIKGGIAVNKKKLIGIIVAGVVVVAVAVIAVLFATGALSGFYKVPL